MRPQDAAREALAMLDPLLLEQDSERYELHIANVPARTVRNLYPYAPENYAVSIKALRIKTPTAKMLHSIFIKHHYEWIWISLPLSMIGPRNIKDPDRFPKRRLAELMRVLNALAEHDHEAYLESLGTSTQKEMETQRWELVCQKAEFLPRLATALVPLLQAAAMPATPKPEPEVPEWFRKRVQRRKIKRRNGHPRAYTSRRR